MVYYISFLNTLYATKNDIEFFVFDKDPTSFKFFQWADSLEEQHQGFIKTISLDLEDNPSEAYIETLVLDYINSNSSINSVNTITLLIDLDDTVFKYSEKKQEHLDKNPLIGYPQSLYGFYSSLVPFDNAICTINRLLLDKRFNVYFATAPSVLNPLSYTEKRLSIEKHFGIEHCEKLIIISEKNLLDDYNVIIIDDFKSGRGQDKFFKGKHIHFGSDSYPDWNSISELLLS